MLNLTISLLVFTRDYAKHPCTQSVCTQGFAVRPTLPYPFNRYAVHECRDNVGSNIIQSIF